MVIISSQELKHSYVILVEPLLKETPMAHLIVNTAIITVAEESLFDKELLYLETIEKQFSCLF